MHKPDINCDMGEGMDNDAMIMPYILSANIACGYHAGDEETMRDTMELATRSGVAVGAHVSFNDRENFGRKEMQLPAGQIRDIVLKQFEIIDKVARSMGIKLAHVKPHGALYNMSARDKELAATIANTVKEYDPMLVLFGLSNSHSIAEAKRLGLQTASEVFADRTYLDDGSLTPRSERGALIDDMGTAVRQVLQMINEGTVTTTGGKEIPILAETICIHGDGKHAAFFARAIYKQLMTAR
jgi:5-oxoprolinase (ATP-hydrolysing) subunit A